MHGKVVRVEAVADRVQLDADEPRMPEVLARLLQESRRTRVGPDEAVDTLHRVHHVAHGLVVLGEERARVDGRVAHARRRDRRRRARRRTGPRAGRGACASRRSRVRQTVVEGRACERRQNPVRGLRPAALDPPCGSLRRRARAGSGSGGHGTTERQLEDLLGPLPAWTGRSPPITRAMDTGRACSSSDRSTATRRPASDRRGADRCARHSGNRHLGGPRSEPGRDGPAVAARTPTASTSTATSPTAGSRSGRRAFDYPGPRPSRSRSRSSRRG